jgi:UDP-N-acetylmuramate dehydrogenase
MNETTSAARQRLEGQAGLALLEHEPLAGHTSFGIGGPADLLVIPHEVPALLALQRALSELAISPIFLGLGTNVLISDAGLRGVVVKLAGGLLGCTVEGATVTAAAGESLQSVCYLAADAGLSGLEFAAGIPGTMGGAVLMNAGAHGGDMAGVVEWVEVAEAGVIRRLGLEELDFGYRQSWMRAHPHAVVRVGLRLTPAAREDTHRRLCEILEGRCARQPISQRSAGSIFKRPPGDYAGRLLEAAGCKGLAVGAAQFSPKHANFIINTGTARASDVEALIELAQGRVREQFGVELEPEICRLGEFGEAAGPPPAL